MRSILLKAALLALTAIAIAAVYTWWPFGSGLPEGPRTLNPAPAHQTLKEGVPGFALVREGPNWVLSADPAVMAGYEWRGTSGLDVDLAILYIRPPGSNGVILVDLQKGGLYAVPDGKVAVASPDLAYLLVKDWTGNVPRTVQELKPNARSYALPSGADWAHWQGAFLFMGGGRPPVVVDPAAGAMWVLPKLALLQRLVAGHVCYEHRESFGEANGVVCFDPRGAGEPVALLSGSDLDPAARVAWLEPDPSGRRLAIAYKSGRAARSAPSAPWTKVAQATPPSPPPIALADTVLIYEPGTGRVTKIPIPAGRRLRPAVWSPDGRYLGLESPEPPKAAGPAPYKPRWRLIEQTQTPGTWRLIFEPVK